MNNNFEKISVICALYIGTRPVQVDDIIDNKLYYFQKQLEYLEKYKNKIFKFYFVVTFENENYSENYKHILNEYNTDIINISFKKNLGGSYTSWKTGLEIDNGKSDLIFLIEDDYVIYDSNAIDTIISDYESDADLFYYCAGWWNNHAAISNGIINNKLYKESGLTFRTTDLITRQSLFDNQITFLQPFSEKGYKIRDYRKLYSSIFSDGVDTMIEYGVPNGKVIFHPLTITK
tara:strand:- start:122 stop:820 length:699 start_codon:yes stop_codon:yes gene_type:complete